ncbi:MAG TPA: PIN domain-containing protein [Candidatus Nanoarchaeia archaeon]|nr:PIN domain-containing protein [Candidatus Nanoarchaeia archaeon]
MTIFFYDSYAVIEYIKNNPNFASYFEYHTGIITVFNLVEICYSVLSESNKEKADVVVDALFPLMVDPSKETIKEAMNFRLHHKKRKLSYADCIGYQIAKERNILFLTGDKEFKDLPDVMFLK